ncbi:exonuclease SbcCD subunit D [Kribbia dieselivorans]|uniref:exonuclease SbcCD subunit D n=1 Tax=Kribbia dieselivorans TaxID=331526 RepID=UPI000838ABD7|nr:exonuclease SbcCD subunit D [Kribbia dieselivorans]
MRILHTSDWHLGRSLHGVDLSAAHQAFLDYLVDLADDQQVDAVLVAGDVYDRAQPPITAVNQLNEALRRLTEKAPVIVTSGNHDSAPRLGFGADLYKDRLHVRTRAEAVGRPITVPNVRGGEGLYVYALPYLEPDMVRDTLSDQRDEDGQRVRLVRSHEAVMTAAMRRVSRDLTNRRAHSTRRVPAVAMAHAFVVGGLASESETDIRVGGVDSIPSGVFAPEPDLLDYVALGHLHGPQRVGAPDGPGPVMRYSGSPLAFSFSEVNHHKTSAIVDIDDQTGAVTTELVAAPVTRRLSEVRGTLEEVLGRGFDGQHDDWTRVVVTGQTRPDGLVGQIKEAFPHALTIQFEHDGGLAAVSGVAAAALDPLDVVAEFVSQMRNAPPADAERKVLRRAYERMMREERSA